LNVSPEAAAKSLLSAAAVRERAHAMLALGDNLPNFVVDFVMLDAAAQLVIETTRTNYPTLDIPFHSRWRHFDIDGFDYWHELDEAMAWNSPAEKARAAFDLAIVSVLLDAGAAPDWRYRCPVSGEIVSRSEGLALASLAMFRDCEFSMWPSRPLRADGSILADFSDAKLIRGFQVSVGNPLSDVTGRVELLRRLGCAVMAAPDVFARNDTPRPGGLFDHLAALARGRTIAASVILAEILEHFGPIWPSRLELGGIPLGDCWRHSALRTDDVTTGLVPLHKLSQWLAYSLIEPLQWAGFEVTDIDGLTGLAEYRNGGLFIDTGVLTLRDPRAAAIPHDVSSELVVEWRALTVALLDRLAEIVRARLNMNRETLPLAKILQGGTWAAGRSVARQKRPDGGPPLKVISDGTVF
jgi:hypothetical protein